MKTKPVYACLAAVLLCCSASAQVREAKNVDSFQLDESKDLQLQLIPLDSIITIALKNSPAVKFQQDAIESSQYQIKFTQQMWTNDISGFFNYGFGNQSLLTGGSTLPGSVSSTNISNGYRTGVQVTLPLYEFFGRTQRIKLYKADLQSSIDKKDQVKQELVQYLIQEFYSLIYYRNLITIRSDAKQSGINQYQVAQQEFKDGIIQASELSRLMTIEVNARADYEEAKRQFSTHYFVFQNLVGVPMQQLMLRK